MKIECCKACGMILKGEVVSENKELCVECYDAIMSESYVSYDYGFIDFVDSFYIDMWKGKVIIKAMADEYEFDLEEIEEIVIKGHIYFTRD